MPIYKSPSGKTIDIPESIDTATGKDKARDEAVAKGWKPQVEMISAKSGKNIYVDQEGMDEAKQKGWVPKHEYQASQAKVEGLTPGKSALLGATQSGTLGFADELYGAAKGLASKLRGGEYTPAYEKARGEARGLYEAAEKENPKSYLGGSLAGGFLTPGGGAKSLVGKVGQGAALGGVTALGSSEATGAKDLAKDVAMGGALGGGFGAAGRAMDVLPGALKGKAQNEALRTLRLSENELTKIPAQKQQEMANTALEYLGPTGALGVNKFEDNFARAGERVGSANEGLAKQYGTAPLSVSEVISQLRKKADEAGFSGAKETLSNAYNKIASLLEKKAPEDSIAGRVRRIRDFGDEAYSNKGLIASDAAQKVALQDTRKLLKDDMIRQIESKGIGGKKAVEELKSADKDYSKLADFEKVVPRITKREELEGGLSRITGGLATATPVALGAGVGSYAEGAKGGATGGAVGLLAHLAMKRKNPLAAYYSNKASQLLGSSLSQNVADRLESAAQKGLIPFMHELDKVQPQ